ncbi:MAG: ROK family protein [Kiritimatiellales bacterium]
MNSIVKKKKVLIAQTEAALLQLVRAHQGVSRVELASLMGLAPSTVGLFVSRLLKDNFLLEEEIIKLKKGRPRTALSLNPKGGHLLGVDFEANRVRIICLNFSEEIEQTISFKLSPSEHTNEILEKTKAAIERILPKNRKRILGLGIAGPGPVDKATGISVYYRYIKDWQNVPLVSYFEKYFKIPVYLENTIRAITSAELWFGQGRTLNQYVCIGVRSGIGIGIVTNGQLYFGANQMAGEVGSWKCPATVLSKAKLPKGTTSVELEEVASVRAVLNNLKTAIQNGRKTVLSEMPASKLTIFDMFDAYKNGDKLSIELLDTATDALGWLCGQIAVLLDPEKIIFSGPIVQLGSSFLNRVKKIASEYTQQRHLTVPEIVGSELGEFSGAMGAAAQIVHYWTPTR